MKLAIMQPYFFPYIAYWQLINAVDVFVIYDDVNYIKSGWINRNNFLINKEKKLFSISLFSASSYKKINEIEIKDNFVKFTKMLKTNYSKAPYFHEVYSLVERIISVNEVNLSKFLVNSIQEISKYLSISTEILISSDIEKSLSLKGQDKVLYLCEKLHANDYFNAIGGRGLYNQHAFESKGITLSFIDTEINQYKQLDNEFVHGLSIIDILMFNSTESVREMLGSYRLSKGS
ncbi:WbqC family protein [Pectobacterium aroidearum]|uniref:WbqC family protein n=1 Tax=Pectobacterium aroidearum TaxID=1201031 RepID=UPI003314DCC8